MIVQVDPKVPGEIREIATLQQTAFWAEVKRRLGIGTHAFDIRARAPEVFGAGARDRTVVDDLLILFRRVSREHQIAYVPYGPTLEPAEQNQGAFLEELSEFLRPLLPPSCILLRYDLVWESPWARDPDGFDADGTWLGPPRKETQEIRVNVGTQRWNLRMANSDILPSNTILLDLQPDPESLLARMKPKTRYNIRLAGRRGVRVRRADLDELAVWYELYRETAERNRIVLHTFDAFQALFKTGERNAHEAVDVDLLIAEHEGCPLAAMFLVTSGHRATYLAGASSSVKRGMMGTYALQWEAIRRARQKGCTVYDMFGVAPRPDPGHPLYGLYRFKTGFGGRLFHRMGCWDYPLDAEAYEEWSAYELNSQGYHLG